MSTLEIIFASLTLLFAAICAFAIIGGVLYFIFKLYSKIIVAIKKVDIIGGTVENLLVLQAPHLLDKYREATASLYNPQPPPDRDMLLAKLQEGSLLPEEIDRLEQILKWEEDEALRRNLQIAGVAIGGVLLLLYILSKQQQR